MLTQDERTLLHNPSSHCLHVEPSLSYRRPFPSFPKSFSRYQLSGIYGNHVRYALSKPRRLQKGSHRDPYSVGNGTPEVATFASGCFWGVEHIFLKHFPPKENKGILKTSVGYTGGKEEAANPDYRTVCSGSTNHAEAVRIEFDPAIVKYEELVGECPRTSCRLRVLISVHQSSFTARMTRRL